MLRLDSVKAKKLDDHIYLMRERWLQIDALYVVRRSKDKGLQQTIEKDDLNNNNAGVALHEDWMDSWERKPA